MVVHKNQIGDFKAKFNGGTRPNRFVITGTMGGALQEKGDVEPLLVKAGSMPVQTLGILQIPFRGRVAKLPGDRVYAEWTFTMIDDIGGEDENEGGLRRKFEEWHAKFNKHEENIVDNPVTLSGTGDDYGEWTVVQLDMTGKEIPNRKIKLINCWPVEVGGIELSYDTADTLTEYSITLAYDYLILAGAED